MPVNSRIVDYSVIMPRVRIVHWRKGEESQLVEVCRECGFEVEHEELAFPLLVKALRATPPDAVVIDLARLPSHGRDTAFALRRSKQTRHIPLVFVDGEPQKVEVIRRQLPDATFASGKQLCSRLRTACAKPVADPVVPPDPLAQYSSRPVAQKLGIREGASVGIIDPPRDYATAIGELPENVELLEDPDAVHSITLWFIQDPRVYQAGLRRMRAIAGRTKLWIIWRKGLTNGLNQNLVRAAANEAGLVDYKICAVGDHWSGMAFAPRKS
jgi:hypothetical protein